MVMKKTNRVLSVILALIMLFSCCVFANAEGNMLAESEIPNLTDMPAENHWAREALDFNIKAQIIMGYEDDTVRASRNMTRAEMAAIINRAFGATVETEIDFEDVKPNHWFYHDIAKAYNMQSFMGTGDHMMDPNDPIRREDVFLAMARVLVLSGGDQSVLDKFADGDEVNTWALDAMATLIEKGYINGDNQNELNPRDSITRAEFSQFMYNIFKTYYHIEGEYSKVNNVGSVMLRGQDITLENATINGDLVLGDGVGVGDAHLTNLTIKGRLLCRGGEGYVYLKNVTVGEIVVVNDVNGTVNFYNYRDEPVFNGVTEYTPATYLQRTAGGGGGGGTTYRTVTFKRDTNDNGIFDDNVTTTYSDIRHNGTVAESRFPTDAYDVNGRAFAGWYDADGNEYTSETKIKKDVVLTPRWYDNEKLALELVYSEGVAGNNTISIPSISINRSTDKIADATKTLLGKTEFATGYDSVHFGSNGIFVKDINGYTFAEYDAAETDYDVNMIKIGLLDIIEETAFKDILIKGYTNADVDTVSQGIVNIGQKYESDEEVRKTIDFIVETATKENKLIVKEVEGGVGAGTHNVVIDGISYSNYDVAVFQFRNLLRELEWDAVKDYTILDFYENRLPVTEDVIEDIFVRTKKAILDDLDKAIDDVLYGTVDEVTVDFTTSVNPVTDMYNVVMQAIGTDATALTTLANWANIARVFAADDTDSDTKYDYLAGSDYATLIIGTVERLNTASGETAFTDADVAVNKWILNVIEVFDKFIGTNYADEYENKAGNVSEIFDKYETNMTVADFYDTLLSDDATSTATTSTAIQELPFVTVKWTFTYTIAE